MQHLYWALLRYITHSKMSTRCGMDTIPVDLLLLGVLFLRSCQHYTRACSEPMVGMTVLEQGFTFLPGGLVNLTSEGILCWGDHLQSSSLTDWNFQRLWPMFNRLLFLNCSSSYQARIALERRRFLEDAAAAVRRQEMWSNMAHEITGEYRSLCAEEVWVTLHKLYWTYPGLRFGRPASLWGCELNTIWVCYVDIVLNAMQFRKTQKRCTQLFNQLFIVKFVPPCSLVEA